MALQDLPRSPETAMPVTGVAAWTGRLPDGGLPDRLPALLGFALAQEAGEVAPPRGDSRAARMAEADRLLTEHAFRLLHNRAEEIRREAAAEALRGMPRPPGFGKLVLAGVVAALLVMVGMEVAQRTGLADRATQAWTTQVGARR